MRRTRTALTALLLLPALAGLGSLARSVGVERAGDGGEKRFASAPAETAAADAPLYYVNRNAQKSGDHEVHTTACRHGAKEHNRVYLGRFASCREAVREAKKHYRQSDGCAWCAPACDHG
jgi:hypothetical protein